MNPPDHGDFVWIDGRIVTAADALVSVFDRGFLYGDSLFESVHVRHGRAFRWPAHLARLAAGAAFLRVPPPDPAALGGALAALLRANAAERGTVRVMLSRGQGRRGYSPRHAGPPTLALTWHAAATTAPRAAWRLATSPYRTVAGDPLAAFKHGARLANVLSRAAAEDAGADEALLLDTAGRVAETASGNVFCLRGDRVCTPPAAGLLPGISRACILELAPGLGLRAVEQPLSPTDLLGADAVFFTASSLGVVPVASLDGTPLGDPPRCLPLARALDALVERETGAPSPA